MPTRQQVLKELEYWFGEVQAARTKLAGLRPESFIDEDAYESVRRQINGQIKDCGARMGGVLEALERHPHRYMGFFDELKKFHEGGAFEDSVFVMTKYPKEGDEKAGPLQKVIEEVVSGIRARGYVPRLAADAVHQTWMWGNVELYLLGCRRGVAIVEDRYLPELNPNVAMEWGWMKAMGREVLFLREKNFHHGRADWEGLIAYEFVWDDPAPGVGKALGAFLPERG